MALKDFLISRALIGPALSFIAEYPVALFAPARFMGFPILALHPGVGMLGVSVMSGYLGSQRFMQLISDKETIKNIAEQMVPAFTR